MEKDLQNEAEAQSATAPGADTDTDTTREGQFAEKDLADDAHASDSPDSMTANEEGSMKPIEGSHGDGEPQKGPAAEPEASRTKLETAIVMISLCASVFLAALDVTIVTTALPTISEHFHSNAGYTWIGSAYLLANAASTPSWGKFSDIWGRKPILLLAVGVFFVGSLLAAVSVSIAMLIVARVIQGMGGGGLIVLVNIAISDLFSMRNRGKYFGMVGMTWALASAVGPLLGGVFTEKVTWRWCFYLNLPITGTVFLALCFFLKLDNPKTPVWDGLKAVDWAGSLTIVGGTLMVLLGLEFGGVTYPWKSAKVICLIVFGFLVGGLFILNEWKLARYPVIPLRIFKYRSNIASLGVCFCHGFVFIAGSYYLPLYFQAVLGASPLLSGVYLLPFALALSFTSATTGIFIKKSGKYLPPIWFGLVLMTVGFGLFIDLPPTHSWAKIIIFQIIAGIGVGPNFQSPLIALQSMISPRDIASATATFGFVRNISTSISVVIGSVVFQNEMQKKYPSLVAALGVSIANELSGGSAGASVGLVKMLPAAQQVIARHAFYTSLRTMWIMYVAFAGLGVFISLFIGNQKLSKEHQVTKTGLAEEEARRKQFKEEKKQGKEDKKASKDVLRKENQREAGEPVPMEEV